MNKFLLKTLGFLMAFLFITLGLSATQTVNAANVDTNTYILNNGNDLWEIIPKGSYYIPRIKYTDAEGVKNKFIQELNYPWDFYSSRNIDKKLLNNESPYFNVEWNRPYFIKSLDGIKKTLSWYLFAYRKNGGQIFWTDAKNFTPAFLSGYESPNNQSIIIYPIKEKKTNKIVAFLQYPCWNLVCRDTMCSDLKVTATCWDGITSPEVGEQCDPKDPKTKNGCTNSCRYQDLACKVVTVKPTIDDKSKLQVKIEKDANIDIKEVFLNRERFASINDINGKTLEPWNYTINATWINKFTGKEQVCDSGTVLVEAKQFCWDGKVTGSEECDYKDPNNNGSCSNKCKFTDISCSVRVKAAKITEPAKLSDVLIVKNPTNTKLTKIELNGVDVTTTNPTIEKDGEYTVKVFVNNSYSNKTATCETKLTFDKKEFCWDWVKNGYEQCDDGNTNNGDWCSRSCKLETPNCKITKEGSVFEEWQPFEKYVKFAFTGKFETAQLNGSDIYTSMEDLLKNQIPRNKCATNSTLTYTVSNPLDPTITKTCTTNFRTKNKEYCGDGIVQKSEQCDPNDPYTGWFCTEECKFKTNTECNVLNNTFEQGSIGAVVVNTDYTVIPYQMVMDGKTIRAKDWIFKHRFTKAGDFQVTLQLKNKADDKNIAPSYCQFNITVVENKCKVERTTTASNYRTPTSSWTTTNNTTSVATNTTSNSSSSGSDGGLINISKLLWL